MKRTYQPKNLRRKRTHGFRARKATVGGRKVLANRRRKGRKRLALWFMGNQSFHKSERLLKRSQFEAVMNRGQRKRVDTTLTLFFLSNGLSKTRLGIIASKRIGNAVIRNRAKRMIREAFRRLKHAGLPGMDLVVISGKNLVSLPLPDLETKIANNLPSIQ